MKIATIAILVLGAASALAQSPTTPTLVPEVPKLTVTETSALNLVSQKSQELQVLYHQIESEIIKNHPGYHLNPSNPLNGELVADPPPAKAEAPKEVKK